MPKVDGVSKTAYLAVRYLQETGREVLVFAPDIAVSSVGPSEVVRVPSLPVPSLPETRMALPNPLITKRLNEFKPDLIHLFSPAVMSVNGMAVGRHLNIPVVANYQTDLPGYAERYGHWYLSKPIHNWLRYLHNGCHVTLVPTKSVIQDLKAEGYRRLREWGRGVNINRFSPTKATPAMRERLLNGRDPNSLVCIFVGRVVQEKRIELLLKVAQLEGVALTIIGDGPMREDLEVKFAHTDTHFMGYAYGDELAQAYASADAFVFTGANETFGQVVQEAMASGIPSIVVNEGGVPDLVEHHTTGLICEATQEGFVEMVTLLRDNPTLRAWMGSNALDVAKQRPWHVIMSQLEDHYREAAEMNQRFKQLFGTTNYHTPFSLTARISKGR